MTGDFDPYYTWLGIPPEEQPATYYRLLAIREFEPSPDVISNAADQRMAFLRTLQVGKRSDLSQRLLNEMAAAKICLLDPDDRRVYDQRLKASKPMVAAPVPQVATAQSAWTPQPPIAASANDDYSDQLLTMVRAAARSMPKLSPLAVAAYGVLALGVVLLASTLLWIAFGGSRPSAVANGPANASTGSPETPIVAATGRNPAAATKPASTQPPEEPAEIIPTNQASAKLPESSAKDAASSTEPKSVSASSGNSVAATTQKPKASTPLPEAVLHFSFDRDTCFHQDGKVFVRDLTQNKRHGEILDGAACGPGRFGDALHLDGKTGCVLVSGEGLALREFTLSAWIFSFESAPAADDAGVIIGTDCIFYYPTQRAASMRVEFLGKDRHRGLHQDGGKIWGPGLHQWRHIAATWDQRRVRLYADGNLVNETNEIVDEPQPTNAPLAIGRWGGRAERQFRGMIDEVALFGRALTESELVSLAQGEGSMAVAKDPSPTFLWAKDQPVPGKIPEPGPGQLGPAAERLEATFQQEMQELISDEKHQALARKLLASTRSISLSPAEWLAVMDRAINEAAAGGNVELAFQTLGILGNQSQTDVLAKRREIISQAFRADKLKGAQVAMLTQQSIALAKDLVASGSPAEASITLETMQTILSKFKSPPAIAERIVRCQAEVTRNHGLNDAANLATKGLEENPADPEANATVGKYLCFVREDWTRGLPYLARGSDSALRTVAEKEGGDLSTAEAQFELADAWWSVAEGLQEEKRPGRLRAAYWYRMALSRLSGPSVAKAEERLLADKSAFIFDGKGRIVTTLQRFAPVTLEAWIKPQTQREAYPIGKRQVVLGQVIGSDIGGHYGLGIGILNGNLAAEYIPGILETQTTVPLGQWTHIAAVFSPDDSRLFVSGKLAGTGLATRRDGGTKFVVSSQGLDNVSNFFCGHIRSVRISTGARYHNSFEAPRVLFPDANTLLLLDAGSTRGSRAIDLSGNGNHGALQGVEVGEEAIEGR